MQKTDDITRACEEIVQNLLNIDNLENNKIKNEIKAVCTKYSLERIPRNNEILSMVNPTDFKKLQNILLTKPVKSASGVAVVAIMPKPFACPHGRCSYCPGGIEFNTPNSYTGKEPITTSTMRTCKRFGHNSNNCYT
jgi:elongator complex protein 3